MASQASVANRASGRRRASILGSACSLLVLVACSPETRPFGNGGSGGTGGSGGSSSSSSSSSGTPCTTTDPDCECVDDKVVARDVDKDLHGSKLCEENPGDDCDDGDPAFFVNECGGCNKNLGGKVGDPCKDCGINECAGDSAIACITPSPAPRQCSGSTPQVCNQALWVDEVGCAAPTPACLNGACVSCAPGEQACSSNVVMVCDAGGQFVEQTICAAPLPACLDAACVQCNPGVKQCVSNAVEVCTSQGTWAGETLCSGSTPVCFKGSCVACNTGDMRCSGTKIQTCNTSHQWVTLATCSGATPACLNATCVECNPGAHKCGTVSGGPVSIVCESTGSWSLSWTSCASSCSTSTGLCTGSFHPRDLDFEVPKLLREPDGAPAPGMRTRDFLDLATGISFG